MDLEIAALEIKQAARTSEVVQQMAIDVEKVCIIADTGDDMLIPDLGQHGATTCFQALCFRALRLQGLPPCMATDFHRPLPFGTA
jgi:hypothetical protein